MAEPMWVLHLDCDGLRPTAIGQHLLAEMEKPEAQAKLAPFKTIFNFDLRKQVHGLTLYSAGKSAQDAVMLVYADFEADRLVKRAKEAEDYRSTTYKAHVIHNWIDENRRGKEGVKPRVYSAIHGRRVVIFGQQEPRVARALDVLDRATASLAGSALFAQLGARGGGGFIQAAARKLDLPNSDPNTALLQSAKSARLEVGEAQGKLKAILNLDATDEEAARQMASVGQGLVALMRMQQDNPGSVKLAEGLALKQDGSGVVATLAVSAGEAIELLKANAAAKAQGKSGK
ncbi:MAG TPA: hypothetical protein P5205_12595 [Candidatus Paceibacterota bacterium]|nr:hypothetical protein [Verrucomicrobiota bacterium]HSA11198.1 hypothetical protein [Candidatus Paceibacterota bacterium]